MYLSFHGWLLWKLDRVNVVLDPFASLEFEQSSALEHQPRKLDDVRGQTLITDGPISAGHNIVVLPPNKLAFQLAGVSLSFPPLFFSFYRLFRQL